MNIITASKCTLHKNKGTFASSNKKTLTRALLDCQNQNGYAALILNEYKILIETLHTLDDQAFGSLHVEINQTMDELVNWFSNISTTDTVAIYNMLHKLTKKAKQKKNESKPDASHFIASKLVMPIVNETKS